MDYTIKICIAMAGLSVDDKLLFEKTAAFIQLLKLIRYYNSEGFQDDLLQTIVDKKTNFICNAVSKSELNEILEPPKVHYDYNKISPVGKFHILEEELIYWSMTTAKVPLVEYGYDRYLEVFKQIFPDIEIN
jgi:hypothetical protein